MAAAIRRARLSEPDRREGHAVPLESDTRLGSYEILAPLGAGAMGEVYRARDTRLGREVALKVLPQVFAADPERLLRFDREARALAALNHPGVEAIHGFEEADGVHFLVLELVPGTTLAERLLRGPLPVREAVALGAQIAEALAAAHERGLVHRDLKPANVAVTPEGRAKLLDFGLAQADAGGTVTQDSPTVTTPAVADGLIRGTAAYMSPEQARGEELDRRSDLWSFGCVLFEMLTGWRAFPGRTVSDTIAAVLEREPDWPRLPPGTPEGVRVLLRRCLRKDRARRLRDAADAHLELEEALGGGEARSATTDVGGRSRARALVAAALAALAVVTGFLLRLGFRAEDGGATPAAVVQRLEVPLPEGARINKGGDGSSLLALSRDGTRLAFIASDRLWVRDLSELEARPVTGVTGEPKGPFFSPDGQWLGFWTEGKLKVVGVDGSGLRTLCDLGNLRGAHWSEDGRILFASGTGELAWISASGGEPEVVATPDPERDLLYLRWPQVLPGGELALATVIGPVLAQESWRTVLVHLGTGELRVLLDSPAGAARYLRSGHLVYLQGGTGSLTAGVLMGVRFDLRSLEARGPAVTLLRGVEMGGGSAAPYYAVSDTGVLVYAPADAAPPLRELVWVDRAGRVELASERRAAFWSPSLSRDGTRVALTIGTSEGGTSDVFILDLERETLTRLTSLGEAEEALWTPDGRHLLVLSSHTGEKRLYRIAADGGGAVEAVTDARVDLPNSMTPDGRALLFSNQESSAQWDLYLLPLEPEGPPQPWLVTPQLESNATVSPDGRWVAYRSHVSGQPQIYVRPLAGPGPTIPVSTHGGRVPRWSRDGRELFFLDTRRGAMMAVTLRSSDPFESDPPRILFDLPDRASGMFDVAADGRFLMILRDAKESDPLRLVVAPSWLPELEAALHEAGDEG